MSPGRRPSARSQPTLLELAQQRFTRLSLAEEEFLRATQEGRRTLSLAKKKSEKDPAKAMNWGADRVVQAECVLWVCTDRMASSLVPHYGVDLRGVRVDGDLNLSRAEIEFFLNAEDCAFNGCISLREAKIRGLSLANCHIRCRNNHRAAHVIDAEDAIISGAFSLNGRITVYGEINLLGVSVGRDLDCSGARFLNPGNDALSADGAKIEGDVLLRDCEGEGSVRLLGATIAGNLDCSGAQFSKQKDYALNVDGGKIGGDVFLSDGFVAKGPVSLSGAAIRGNLDCIGGRFLDRLEALRAEGATIDGDVLFKDDFKANGEVKLSQATIGGTLNCEQAQFSKRNDALTADVVRIKGDVIFGEGFEAEGEVRLFGAIIGGDLDCNGAHFNNAGDALSVDAAKIEGTVRCSGGLKAKGRIGLSGTVIGGDLDCEDTELSKGNESDSSTDNDEEPVAVEGEDYEEEEEEEEEEDEEEEEEEEEEEQEQVVLNADGAKIGGSIFFKDGFKAKGEVSLIGATIGGDLDFGDARFEMSENDAISADRAQIGGDVMFDEGFTAAGVVRLPGAKIGGDLECQDARFSNSGGDALNAAGAKIEGGIALRKGFKVKGCVNLSNVEVSGALDLQGLILSKHAILDLRSTKVGTIRDDEANWKTKGKLFLDGFVYERFHSENPEQTTALVAWLHRQPRRQFLPQPYEQLAAVLRKMGHERAARQIMIEKNLDRARFAQFPRQGWWWYKVFGRAIGYGYAPSRAFLGSLAMVLIGFALFQVGYWNGLVLPAKESAYATSPDQAIEIPTDGRKVSKDYPAFNAFVYSLESFTPLLKLDQTANWAPNANSPPLISIKCLSIHAGDLLRSYLYLHIVTGWLLTSLWVGAVTGLVKS